MPKPTTEDGERIAAKVADIIRELVYEKWPEIAEVWNADEDGDLRLGAKVTLTGNPRKCALKVRVSWAQRFAVEADATLDDPDQMALGLDAQEAA